MIGKNEEDVYSKEYAMRAMYLAIRGLIFRVWNAIPIY